MRSGEPRRADSGAVVFSVGTSDFPHRVRRMVAGLPASEILKWKLTPGCIAFGDAAGPLAAEAQRVILELGKREQGGPSLWIGVGLGAYLVQQVMSQLSLSCDPAAGRLAAGIESVVLESQPSAEDLTAELEAFVGHPQAAATGWLMEARDQLEALGRWFAGSIYSTRVAAAGGGTEAPTAHRSREEGRSSLDELLARHLAACLRAAGHEVFVAKELTPGTKWPDAISSYLQACSHFVVLLSERSVASQWVSAEIRIAAKRQGEDGEPDILPVYLESIVPHRDYGLERFIGQWQPWRWKDESDTERVANELCRRVGSDRRQVFMSFKHEGLPSWFDLDALSRIPLVEREALRAHVEQASKVLELPGRYLALGIPFVLVPPATTPTGSRFKWYSHIAAQPISRRQRSRVLGSNAPRSQDAWKGLSVVEALEFLEAANARLRRMGSCFTMRVPTLEACLHALRLPGLLASPGLHRELARGDGDGFFRVGGSDGPGPLDAHGPIQVQLNAHVARVPGLVFRPTLVRDPESRESSG